MPNSAITTLRADSLKYITPALRMERKKSKLLKLIELSYTKHLKDQDFEYPDIIKMARNLFVDIAQTVDWMSNDKEFKAKLEQIEQLCLMQCRRIVYNSKKTPYLAMQLLQARAPEFQKEIKHSGVFAHFHIHSNVRSKPEREKAIIDNAELIAVEAIAESTTGEIEAPIAENTGKHISEDSV